MDCLVCSGSAQELGTLGHYRCRACGYTFSDEDIEEMDKDLEMQARHDRYMRQFDEEV